ncbi:hypothetical protein ACFSR7_14265 [Cohnella sp. GCM10020058]|uniref:hypothetical protein n=1 Tax=Cohnella sp. GCM10020058 TaxID=3317330 RepID=UPI00362C2CFD
MSVTGTTNSAFYKSGYIYSAQTSAVRMQTETETDAQENGKSADAVEWSMGAGRPSGAGYARDLTTQDKRDLLAGMQERLAAKAGESGKGEDGALARLADVKSQLGEFDVDGASDEAVEAMFAQVRDAMGPRPGHIPEECADGDEAGDGTPPLVPPQNGQTADIWPSWMTDGASGEDDGSGAGDGIQALLELLTEDYDETQGGSKQQYADELKHTLADMLGDEDFADSPVYSNLAEKLDAWADADAEGGEGSL